MRFTLTIDSENDALAGEDGVAELREIVHKLSQRLLFELPTTEGAVADSNGNTVGHWRWTT